MKYDVDYFIDKFSKIPDNMWVTNNFGDKKDGPRCAMGWCGTWVNSSGSYINGQFTNEGKALTQIMKQLGPIVIHETIFNDGVVVTTSINDDHVDTYKQSTPKERILAALQDVKQKQEQDKAVEEVNEIIKTPEYEYV